MNSLPVNICAKSSQSIAERKALRSWKKVDRNRLRQSILSSELCAEIPQTSTAESLFDTYEHVLHDIAD